MKPGEPASFILDGELVEIETMRRNLKLANGSSSDTLMASFNFTAKGIKRSFFVDLGPADPGVEL